MSGNLVPILFANICGGIFVLVLVGLGLYLIIFSMRSKKKAEESQGWPSTTGSVTRSEVKRSVNRDEDGIESISYYPSVEYTYSVSNQSYAGKRLSFGGIVNQKDPAQVQKTLERYTPGAAVTVYFDPLKPSEAVLERKASGLKWGLAGGIICLVLSFCIACPLMFGLISNLLNQ